MASSTEGVNVANAFVTIMPSMQGAQTAITEAILPAASSTGEKAGTTMGSMLTGKLGKAVAAFTSAFTVEKVFSGLMGIGEQFEDLKDSIIQSTGASGAALGDMENSAKEIAENIPISIGAAGTIVESLAKRMGLTGDTLTTVGEQIAAVQRMTGQAVDVSTLTGAFNMFGVTADQVSGQMDTLYAVSQNTGISFNDLVSSVQSSGPAMTEMGFSMTDTAEIAGKMSESGIDASSTLMKMSHALPALAAAGEAPRDTLNRLTGQIKDYIAQGNDSAAIQVANNLFGTRGAAQFLAAVKTGSLDIDNLSASAQSAGGNILQTVDATHTWHDTLQLLQNKLSETLEPLANGLLEGINGSFDGIADTVSSIDPSTMQQLGADLGGTVKSGLEFATDALKWVVSNGQAVKVILGGIAAGFAFNTAVSGVSTTVSGIKGIASAAAGSAAKVSSFGNTISLFAHAAGGSEAAASGLVLKLGKFGPAIAGAADKLGSAFSAVTGGASKLFAVLAANPIILVVAAIALLVAGLVYFFTQTETGRELWASFTGWLSTTWQSLSTGFMDIVSGVVSWFQSAWGAVTGFISLEILGWQIIFQGIGDFFTAVWQGASDVVSGIVGGITGFFSAAGADVQSTWQGVVDWFSGVPDAISGFFSGLADLLSAPFRAAFDNIRSFWNSTIGGFGITIPDWIPAIGGQSFTIPYLASGGIVDSAQLAMIGEAGPEVVTPLSKIQPIVNQAVQSAEPKSSGMSDVAEKLDYIINTLGQTIRDNAPSLNIGRGESEAIFDMGINKYKIKAAQ